MIRIHNCIRELIYEFRRKLEELIPDKLYGLYLYNSVAMGNFEPEYSDIDFIVLLKDYLTEKELLKLADLHKRLGEDFTYGKVLEGMYLQYTDLGKSNQAMKPYPYAKVAQLYKKGHYDINAVTWWSMKTYTMEIDSPQLKEKLNNYNWSNVIDTMDININNYWTKKLENKALFLEDLWVEFGVVTLSRIIYTLEENSMTSKTKACHYILGKSNQWDDILNEALAIRERNAKSVIGDTELRQKKTIEYLSYMINYGNELLQKARRH